MALLWRKELIPSLLFYPFLRPFLRGSYPFLRPCLGDLLRSFLRGSYPSFKALFKGCQCFCPSLLLFLSQTCPFTIIHVGKIGLSGVIVGANSKSTFAPKTGYQPLFPSRGPVPGDLTVKFCSVVGARCLQRWRFFARVWWPIFGSILRIQIWTHVFISVLKVNIGVQTWTHFWVHFVDPNLVRQLEPKTHKNRIRGSSFRNPQLHCGKAVAAQAALTNWRGTDLW